MPGAPDRLSALDAAFLDLETGRAPLHVGWTMRFAGKPPAMAALRRHVDARLDGLPRLRRRIVEPALGLGDAHWVDDAGFDVGRHVHAVDLPPGAGAPADLQELAGVLLSAPLDPLRPLWRLTLVRGLSGGFAVVGQAHHALVDGIAAVELAQLLLEPAGVSALPRRGPAPVWEPQAAPGTARGLAQAGTHRAREAGRLARGAGAADLPAAAAGLGRLALPAPRTALDRAAGPGRRMAFASAPLDDLRAAARARGATINDVLLAAAAVAVGGALERRGDAPPAVRALVPVSTRREDEDGTAHGNRISLMGVDLPLGERDPALVLRTVRDRTRARKRSGEAAAADALARAAEALPAPGRRLAARAAARRAQFTLIVSNVPGPPLRLALLGRELEAAWPAVPLLDGRALTIGALSYDGTLHAGLFADAEVVPDAAQIAADLEAALCAIAAAGEPQLTPWRARARARRAVRRTA